MLTSSVEIDQLNEVQLRELTAALIKDLKAKQALIDRLTHEMAIIKRLRFAAKSEQFNAHQRSLFEEDSDVDLEVLAQELEPLRQQTSNAQPQKPKRQALPADLPRRDVHHEATQTVCTCGCSLKRIGEDVAEKLDYTPGQFTVERHVRGKWVCTNCETLIQAPVPAHVIDKGMPTAGLLAQVLVAKYIDHLPLYRQESIFARAGFAIPRSTTAQWVGCVGVALMPLVQAIQAALLSRQVLHVDETPVSMLSPGKGKTHRAYLWSYCTTAYDPIAAVVFDFADSRAGKHAREFLGFDDERPELGWRGTLVCDDYSGYKALFPKGVTEAGCLAHARRKFFDLWANHKSAIAEEA
ncbi:MAG: IS66 family transposase, partial [Betaproteobacteria bacterium]|nr:IS66 family transposase [Betaproteobacteria bacterium]